MFRNVLFEFLEVLECSIRISRKSRNSLMTSHRLVTSERDYHWMCWLMCRPIKGCAGWSTDDESPNIEEAGEKRKFKGDHRLRFPKASPKLGSPHFNLGTLAGVSPLGSGSRLWGA